MKFALALALMFTSAISFADMICDGRELTPGNFGRTGTLVMSESPFAIRWSEETTDVVGPGTLCGVKLNATTVCQTLDHSRGPTIAARRICADKDKGPFENKVGEGYFAYSNVNHVGRFGCSNTGGANAVEKTVEINNCR